MVEPPPQQIHAMLAELWVRTRPVVLDRIDRIELAIAALGAGTIDPQTSEAARTDAHQLTGLLGTYGLGAGSDLARTVEQRLAAGATREDARELGRLANGIRAIVTDAVVAPAPG